MHSQNARIIKCPSGQIFLWMGDEIFSMYIYQPMDSDIGLPDVMDQIGRVWVDVVVKADGKIVGCTVFEMVMWKDVMLTVEYVGSDYSPPADGQYQNISEEFVRQRIEAYHETPAPETAE